MLQNPGTASPQVVERLPSHQVLFVRSNRPLKKKQNNASMRRRNRVFFLMCAPALVLLAVFAYIPMYGIIIAFKDYLVYKGIFGSDWVGFQNFQFLFATSDAWRITYNTLFMNALFIITGTIGSLVLALLLNEVRDKSRILGKFYQSTLILPHLLSWVLVNFFVTAILDPDTGLLDHWITNAGGHAINWYTSPQYWPLILTLLMVWKSAGFNSIIYLAGIVGINPEYYEAAQLDGANKVQSIWNITVPLLRPLIIMNTLLAIGHIFYADFGLFFIVTHDSSLLYQTADVIDTYVYRALTSLGDVGMASAAGSYQAVVGFVLVLVSNWIVKRIDPEKAIF